MNKIVKNTSLYTIGNILPKAISFLLLPLYTKFLTPEDYGILNSMILLRTFLIVFMTMAINKSVYRLYFDYEEKRKASSGQYLIKYNFNWHKC
ncbi:MAG: oligosaccharide flippase family protein [Halanaerobiales bacterium]|nr:oligosaccharide flippase family protein [Halanaerobiales bacterium]